MYWTGSPELRKTQPSAPVEPENLRAPGGCRPKEREAVTPKPGGFVFSRLRFNPLQCNGLTQNIRKIKILKPGSQSRSAISQTFCADPDCFFESSL
jgi:hypothetical protein